MPTPSPDSKPFQHQRLLHSQSPITSFISTRAWSGNELTPKLVRIAILAVVCRVLLRMDVQHLSRMVPKSGFEKKSNMQHLFTLVRLASRQARPASQLTDTRPHHPVLTLLLYLPSRIDAHPVLHTTTD